MYETSTHFPIQLPDVQEGFEGLEGPWMGLQYFADCENGNSSSASQSIAVFSGWLRSGVLVHPLTRTVLGGPWGVKWPALVLIRAYWTATRLDLGELPPNVPQEVSITDQERSLVTREAVWLTRHIEDSIGTLQAMYEAASQVSIPPLDGIVIARSARRHVPEYMKVRT